MAFLTGRGQKVKNKMQIISNCLGPPGPPFEQASPAPKAIANCDRETVGTEAKYD